METAAAVVVTVITIRGNRNVVYNQYLFKELHVQGLQKHKKVQYKTKNCMITQPVSQSFKESLRIWVSIYIIERGERALN